ncbi:MAG TPA: hypothetical protein VFH73_27245 [Polyangia bacterium]|jgi:hypothetical protein|nr:hypothetical protein [Polyangia bacterium]
MKQPRVVLSALLLAGALLIAAPMALADGTHYELQKTEPKVAVGAKSSATVTIAAKNGWHLNAEAPFSVSLVAPTGLTLSKTKLGRSDLAKSTQDAAQFEIAFEAIEAGIKVVTGEARFVLCQEAACKPVKETVSINIEVTPPTAAPAAKAKRTKKI